MKVLQKLLKNILPEKQSEEGFALVAALIATMILLAIGILVISLSTGDLKTSSVVVGDKKALAAVESGIHNITQTFDPGNAGYGLSSAWQQIDSANDPGAQYRVLLSGVSSYPALPMPGYSMESGQGWGMSRFNVRVEGQHTSYNSDVQVDVGMGYGPVPTGTIYR
jgi:hypothetical protein